MKYARLVVPVVVVCLAAATAAGQSFQIDAGGGYDRIYLGTRAGAE